METIGMIFKVLMSLTGVLLIIYILVKFANVSGCKLNNSKNMKVLERTQLGKDSFLLVVKVLDEGCVLAVSNGHTEKIKDLSKEEILKIEEAQKKRVNELRTMDFSKGLEFINKKLLSKDEGYEK